MITNSQLNVGISEDFRNVLKKEADRLRLSMSAYGRICMTTGHEMLMTEKQNGLKNFIDEGR